MVGSPTYAWCRNHTSGGERAARACSQWVSDARGRLVSAPLVTVVPHSGATVSSAHPYWAMEEIHHMWCK
jgi:hypothetical protein